MPWNLTGQNAKTALYFATHEGNESSQILLNLEYKT